MWFEVMDPPAGHCRGFVGFPGFFFPRIPEGCEPGRDLADTATTLVPGEASFPAPRAHFRRRTWANHPSTRSTTLPNIGSIAVALLSSLAASSDASSTSCASSSPLVFVGLHVVERRVVAIDGGIVLVDNVGVVAEGVLVSRLVVGLPLVLGCEIDHQLMPSGKLGLEDCVAYRTGAGAAGAGASTRWTGSSTSSFSPAASMRGHWPAVSSDETQSENPSGSAFCSTRFVLVSHSASDRVCRRRTVCCPRSSYGSAAACCHPS